MSEDRDAPDAGSKDGALLNPAFRRVLEAISKIAAPATILVALMFYFGWSHTNALYRFFGLDQSVLAFSTDEYVLRSIRLAFAWLAGIAIYGLIAVWLHFALRWLMRSRWADRHPQMRVAAAGVVCAIGVGLLIAGYVIDIFVPPGQRIERLFYPLAWTLGIAITTYGIAWIAKLKVIHLSPEIRTISQVFVAALLLLGLFSSVHVYADSDGYRAAQQLVDELTVQPRVIVYSRNPLSLETSGVWVTQVSDDPDAYRYRYTGLRFLVRSDRKFFLLPDAWRPNETTTVILPDTEDIRVELAPGQNIQP